MDPTPHPTGLRPPRASSGPLRRALATAAVAALVFGACSGDDEAVSTTAASTRPTTTPPTTTTMATTTTTTPPTTTTTMATTTSSSTSSTTTTTLPIIPRQPLTGMPLGEGEHVNPRPALAVKIDNASPARRNHTGLGVADIVFEEIVEGSITRFAAVFHSRGSEVVGPIRSGRSQDVDMLTPFNHPLFAWSGGNPGVERLIAGSALTDLNWQEGGRGYYRGSGRIPHNLYNSTEALWAQTPADHPGSPPLQFHYVRPGSQFAGTPVDGFELAMRGIDVDWLWNADQGRFLRSQEGRAHVDVRNGQIGATNVIVLGVEYRPSQIDARSPEAQTIGTGPLWVFSDGEVIHGTWSRATPTESYTLFDEAQNTIEILPGNTWIELAERLPTFDPENPGIELEIAFA